mmetsp:Transcript_8438/g.35262  ORF Transcript_8438/g.35262 Transcript_8438/m.35262 type:complete len:315 (+) Transcript_8438:41-985(+)|eukprot:CAMPEP_0114607394 /NCGR_PEP_ID=MMETSP0168-20121206/2047_1 /TAXON_ID=95228 ORGANISM="Vannella sp., Strain DIVA3 517/6/12" /NCGR_SAMPLE_ID=MMETSP0168 /ASSEMBLY_ACC=CAM_ASM_000044 /LENGTH=314 /DNA_ID=CAMNT_0001818273 /DNA_START=33 /DNA_END=977 /DNA_ORIENTATION=-
MARAGQGQSRVRLLAAAAAFWAVLTVGILVGWELGNGKHSACDEQTKSLGGSVEKGSAVGEPQARGRGVVLSTYFTSKPDFQRKAYVASDTFAYIQPLYDSAIEQGVDLVLFHDGLSQASLAEWSNERVSFVSVALRATIAMNDERFLFYDEFLAEHSEYDYVLMADVSDVELLGDPFRYVRADNVSPVELGCQLWISEEKSTGKAAQWLFGHPDPCYNQPRNFVNKNIDLRRRLYNAGAIAGTRENVQRLLRLIAREFARMDHHEANCNMAVLQYVIQKHYNVEDVCDTGMCWKDLCGHGDTVIAHKRGETSA